MNIEPSWVLGASISILFLDIFFETKFLTGIATLGVSFYLWTLLDVSAGWSLAVLVIIWVFVSIGYYLLSYRLLIPIIGRMLSLSGSLKIHKPESAEIKIIEGKTFAYWNGDLWPVDAESAGCFNEGDIVRIVSSKYGKIKIKDNDNYNTTKSL